MQDFEKLGMFYLGRLYDVSGKKPKEELLLYDSKDLVTHAVCVGMTGSGKTGLCIALLEEAAIDGIPAIVIDPKGDLLNLLLSFPKLRPEDFSPWINEDDAKRSGVSPQEYAVQQAAVWKKGLAEWGQDGARIDRLRQAANFSIYTPGSNAGSPVSILKSFAAPDKATQEDAELLRDHISGTATSLLALLGIEADPLQSREHILVSTILNSAWKQGQDLDLTGLIQQIQKPPVSRIGVLEVESFFPSKDRFDLALRLNNLLAAPGFESWLEGDALDIDSMLRTAAGKPRLSIFSISHLSDAERMFFVSLLLNQVLSWVRTQSGTTSLRALLYMDEIFGYFPPVSNPPSKTPLLTLLKQSRAFGLGIVLATQNPVDLDYKGLANTGTWFIGRLQTDRDKSRVLDGLEGAAATTSTQFDRRRMEQILAGLGNRIFLMNNVHEDHPEVFQSRWTLSYLRGPLTRNQIKALRESDKSQTSPLSRPVKQSSQSNQPVDVPRMSEAEASGLESSGTSNQPPVLPASIPQYFIALRGDQPGGSTLRYRATLFGSCKVYYSDPKKSVDTEQTLSYVAEVTDGPVSVDWQRASQVDLAESDLEKTSQTAVFEALPSEAGKAKNYESWKRSLADAVYRAQKLELLRSASAEQLSKPGETERDFRTRLQQTAREARDQLAEVLRQKFAPKMTALQERIRRAQQAVEREAQQATNQKLQTAISFGATLLGAFMGRKTLSATNIGRATTAMRGVSRSMKESQDVARAGETVEALQQQLNDLENQFRSETEALETRIDPMTEKLETIVLKPKKTNISVNLVALAWAPHWQDSSGRLTAAWK
jgi:DNA helicase HerA-like ATPase